MVDALGSPAWVHTAGITDYGGHVRKANLMARGVNNPLTDVGAAALMRLADHVSSAVRVAPFAKLYIKCNDAAPAAPTVYWVHMMTDVTTTTYAGGSPPAGFPTLSRVGTGSVQIVFASSYTDSYGNSADIELNFGDAQVLNTANPYGATVVRGNAYTWNVYTWDLNADAAIGDQDLFVELA